MVTKSLSEELLNDLGEEFAERIRRGENPSVNDYTSRFPAEQTREVAEFLDSIAMLELLKRGDERAEKKPEAMPTDFGRYQIERSLGEGGMGAVYLAHDSQLDRKVALKTPKFASNSDPNLISRFYREARSAATLQHPNICPVYDVGEIGGIHYISMAYIEGRPLSDIIQSKTFPPVASVIRVVRKVALALHEAHAQGVVHRDLKPANIMIGRRSEPIVMDFGLARQFGSEASNESNITTEQNTTPSGTRKVEARLTLDGTVVGSPGYMSPEQLRGEHDRIGPASDVYALGVLLYELLTRELPFPGDGSLMSIINSVISDDPPDASAIRPQLDLRVVAICKKAMAKNVEDRYESMQTLAVALTEVLKSDTDDGLSPKVPEMANLASSPELVRTKEQYELARSLYQEHQYAAAVSILEKMVAGAEKRQNQYTTWANSELPKARAKAERPSSDDDGLDAEYDDGFWNEDLGAAAIATTNYGKGSTRTAKHRRKKKGRFPKWGYAVASASAAIVVLVAAMIVSSLISRNRRAIQGVAKSTQTATAVAAVDETPVRSLDTQESVERPDDSPAEDSSQEPAGEPEVRPPGANRPSPAERFWRLDSNDDGKISRLELNNVRRLPQSGAMKRVVDNFDDFDLIPRDGLLDREEIDRAARIIGRPGGRDNRRPPLDNRRPLPPPRGRPFP
ncbi:MAG: protein kinase [Fuerstiella sp.]|nr:protein kinase [Fuerstiella sp.]